MGHNPRPKRLPDTSSLFNCRSASELFPGVPIKLPGKPCPACDGSGVDSLADLEESDLRSSAEWSERIERIREAEVGFGDCAGEVR